MDIRGGWDPIPTYSPPQPVSGVYRLLLGGILSVCRTSSRTIRLPKGRGGRAQNSMEEETHG